MITLSKKQLLILVLFAGIVAPVSAMESDQDSSWFGWKAGAGITALVCAGVGYYAYTKWAKPTEEARKVFVQPQDETGNLKLETPEDIERAQAENSAQLEELERQIAQEKKAKAAQQNKTGTTVKRPAGPAGRKKPSRNATAEQKPQVKVEGPVATTQPKAPKKPVGGQSYGVSLADLQKKPLKKTAKKTPAKRVPAKK